MKGKFIVFVGPSTSGKTELVKALLREVPNSIRLTTTTSRPKRPEETNDYFFITKEEFESRITTEDFFEYAIVHGNLYGSAKKDLDDARNSFEYVFAIIDVQGALTLKAKIDDVRVIFIDPGSIEDIKKRIKKYRVEISEVELKRRIENVTVEMSYANKFDDVVMNIEGHFGETVKNVIKIL